MEEQKCRIRRERERKSINKKIKLKKGERKSCCVFYIVK